MGIGTSDGKYYDSEHEWLLDTPKRTINDIPDPAVDTFNQRWAPIDPINQLIDQNTNHGVVPDKDIAGRQFAGVGDWVMGLFNSDLKTETIKQEPPSIEWPKDQDIIDAINADLSYGNPVAGSLKPGSAKVNEVTKKEAIDVYNTEGKKFKDKQRLATPKELENTYKAWLAARRSPLAELGFEPHNMYQTDDANLTAAGFYMTDTNQSWFDTRFKSTPVHESMHRGFQKLRDAEVIDNSFNEEKVVRALMLKYFGDVEKGRGEAGDKQIEAAKLIPSYKLDEIEKIAATYLAKKRPMGPR